MIGTLAYGFDRRQAEALAEATNRYIVPDLVTKQDLSQEIRAVKQDLTALDNRVSNLETRLLAAIHTAQFQSIAVIAGLTGLALAIGKLL
jgi:predicted  nucleic acid-binding Zn-ribbon protein